MDSATRDRPFTLADFVAEWHAEVRPVYSAIVRQCDVDDPPHLSLIPWDDISEPDRPFVRAGCTLRQYSGYLYGASKTTKMRGSFWVVELPEDPPGNG
jgi:hypothetical protein